MNKGVAWSEPILLDISKAIKYSPDAQTVGMDLSASDDAVTICVRDA